MSEWQDWVGRRQTLTDTIDPRPAEGLAATLDRADMALAPGEPLPAVWNWLYFLERAPISKVGPDGHPERGGFLPPIPYPRRMWAGSRCRFHAPLLIGETAEKVSTIESIAEKEGKAGPLVFVTVRHEISGPAGLAIEEEQDIVYMPIPEQFTPPPGKPLPACDWTEHPRIDPVVLFRFSALTFNGHRIHYDLPYAKDTEHYPGLVVHGPLQAVLLFDAACRHAPGRTPASFDFRGMRPLFDFDEVSVNGAANEAGGLDLYTANGEGLISMKATLGWA